MKSKPFKSRRPPLAGHRVMSTFATLAASLLSLLHISAHVVIHSRENKNNTPALWDLLYYMTIQYENSDSGCYILLLTVSSRPFAIFFVLPSLK